MKQKGILFTAFLLLLTTLFYKNYQEISDKTHYFSNHIKSIFLKQKEMINTTIKHHFYQEKQIQELQNKLHTIEKSASLSVAFASKLNHLLNEANLTTFNPKLHLVQVLGYESMQDTNKLWLEFPHFQKGKNYGLLYQGYTAGIIKEKNNQPLAILQMDKASLFSVYIGESHIQGVAYGHGHLIEVKYIPNYKNPKIGDEVITSGNDNLFYEGIKVGKVIDIQKKDMYKIATLKPYVTPKDAQFFYAVEVK